MYLFHSIGDVCMTNNFGKTLIVLLLAITFALTLSAVAQSIQPALLQVRPSNYPTPVTTPAPVATVGPTRGPVVTSYPVTTPAPSGGAVISHEYGLPYHPASTPTPAPSGGYVPVKGNELPYTPHYTPTPAPARYGRLSPGAAINAPGGQVKPMATLIPQSPATRFRTRSS
jgi:hypothetical protein